MYVHLDLCKYIKICVYKSRFVSLNINQAFQIYRNIRTSVYTLRFVTPGSGYTEKIHLDIYFFAHKDSCSSDIRESVTAGSIIVFSISLAYSINVFRPRELSINGKTQRFSMINPLDRPVINTNFNILTMGIQSLRGMPDPIYNH